MYIIFQSANYLAQYSKDAKSKKDSAEYASAAWRQIVAKYQVTGAEILNFVMFCCSCLQSQQLQFEACSFTL